MRYPRRLLLLALGLTLATPALAGEPTFAIQGFTLGGRINPDELENFACIRSRWTGAERECSKKKEWKQVSASTSLFLDPQDRLQVLSQRFDNIEMTEKSAEDVIVAHSKRFKLEPRRVVKQIGADKVIVASWGDVELADIDIQTRLAAIQGRQSDELLLMDLINNIEKSALDVLPIYEIKGKNGAIWTFYIRSGAPGWAMARIISRGESASH
jgi:hypothetical protein